MKKTWLAASLIALGGIGIQGSAIGHGGTYRGPGDTVPPGGGGAGGGGGGPAGPGSPGAAGSPGGGNPGAGPITGAPGQSGPGQTGGRNGAITGDRLIGGPDLTGWSFWWEFNKDYYLNLKEALFTDVALTGDAKFFTGEGRRENAKESLRPSPTLIRQEVVPALLAALETETNNDIITGCMIALAKIGDHQLEDGSSPLAAVFGRFLSDGNQEIRETAALALGILANDGSVALLTDLMTDSEAGRELVGRSEVDYRQRAFAAYGLALVGNRTASEDIRRRIVRTLAEAIDSDQTSTRDLKVACIIGMGLVPLATLGSPRGEDEEPLPAEASRLAQVDYLLRFFKDEHGQPVEQAHCPTALTRLAQKLPADRAEQLKQRLAREFMECIGKRTAKQYDDAIQQSAVLALGQLGDCDGDPIDADIRSALIQVPNFTADQQVRYFAQVALGEIGGRSGTSDSTDGRREVSSTLARTLSNGNAGARWAGLGIGVMGHALARTGEGRMPEELVLALRSELTKAKSPEDLGAFSVAIGMAGDQHSSTVLLDKLERLNDELPRGYVALSLGLLNDRQAIESIQQVVRESKYRPELLKQAAIALGLLGDKDLVPELIDMLRESKSLASQASISSALGFIGDRRSIAPLVEMLNDKALTDSARGFAAVALGTVADKELFPWNHKIASGLNYRASTVTLNSADDGTGVLNIL